MKKLKVAGVVYAVQNITELVPIVPSEIDNQNKAAETIEPQQPEEAITDLDIDNV